MQKRTLKTSEAGLDRFGKRLRSIRQSRKLSLAELGELSQTNLNQISRYERGAVAPTIDIIFRLAEALAVTVGELVDVDPRPVGPEELEIFERLREIEKLPVEDKSTVKKLLDAFLTSHRVKEVASKAS